MRRQVLKNLLGLAVVGTLVWGASLWVGTAAARTADGEGPPVDTWRSTAARAATPAVKSPEVVEPMTPSTSMVRSPAASSAAPMKKRALHDPGPAAEGGK